MDEQQLARLAMDLIKRANITGAEVPAYVEVNNWLQSKAQPAVPTQDPSNEKS